MMLNEDRYKNNIRAKEIRLKIQKYIDDHFTEEEAGFIILVLAVDGSEAGINSYPSSAAAIEGMNGYIEYIQHNPRANEL